MRPFPTPAGRFGPGQIVTSAMARPHWQHLIDYAAKALIKKIFL
jgi:hypothetical protein